MCSICRNSQPRTYTHSRTTNHRKALFKLMLNRLKSGYYNSRRMNNFNVYTNPTLV